MARPTILPKADLEERRAEAATAQPRGNFRLAALLTLLVAMGPISTDLYLPSLPSMARDLGASASAVQLSIGLFVAGFAVMQLAYGPLSDRFGRKPVLLVGMGVYLAATLACALAASVAVLLAARFVQALGGCAGPVIGRAVVRDVYAPEEAARILSYMASAMAIAPLIGPFLGGLLDTAFGWRANFVALLIYAALVTLALWRGLGETLARPNLEALRLRALLANFGHLLRSPTYVGFMLCASLAYGGLFSWISNSAFVVIDRFGVPPARFGWFFGIVVIGYSTGAFLSGRYGGRLGIVRTLGLGAAIGAAAGLALAVGGWAQIGGLPLLTLAMAVYFLGCGLVLAPATAGALIPFPQMAGTASALLGCVQMLTGMLVNALSSVFFDGTERPMVTLTAACAVGVLVVYALSIHRGYRREPKAPERGAQPMPQHKDAGGTP